MGHTHRNKHVHQSCILLFFFKLVTFLQIQRLFMWFLLIFMKVILIMSIVYFSNAFVCGYILLFCMKIHLKNVIFIKLLWYKEWNNHELFNIIVKLTYIHFSHQLRLLLGFEVICIMTNYFDSNVFFWRKCTLLPWVQQSTKSMLEIKYVWRKRTNIKTNITAEGFMCRF